LLRLLLVFAKNDHNIGFEKTAIFLPKIGKNAENCHNPRFGEFGHSGRLFALCSFTKITELAKYFGYFFHGKSCIFNFDKRWGGPNFGRYLLRTHLVTLNVSAKNCLGGGLLQ
jgi:hypothetical protein